MTRKSGIVAMLLIFAMQTAHAQRVRLDDSLSPVDTAHTDLHWEDATLEQLLGGTVSEPDAVIPATGVFPAIDIRLDTSDFVGQRARIYLTLPEPAIDPASLQLSWEANGAFLSGTVQPGQSVLIFEGIIEQAITAARFDFFLSVQPGAGSPDRNSLEAIYELEILP